MAASARFKSGTKKCLIDSDCKLIEAGAEKMEEKLSTCIS
jgi:hypothetical protein